jgi:hypothetical protein
MTMTWRLTAAATAAFIVLGGTARADILSGGPACAASSEVGGDVLCTLFNAGTQTVTVSYRQIYDQLGNLQSLVSDTCNTSLAAGKSYFYEADIKTAVSLSCRAVTNSIDNNVSGAIELFATRSTEDSFAVA